MKEIRVYHTHIEISPYKKGENEKIERLVSLWNPNRYEWNEIGMVIEDEILYIPRGISINILEKEFNTKAKLITTCDDYKILKTIPILKNKPRGVIQTDSIDFLNGEGKFKYTRPYSQLSLNLQPGDGKTYCCVSSIMFHRMKAIIITHADKIKKQWITTCMDMFTFDEDSLIDIKGSNVIWDIMKGQVKGDIYFVNHQTLQSFARSHGYTALRNFFKIIEVGIKVYDEAHLEFKNIVRVDMFSDTMFTYYLTATFKRSDPTEDRMFSRFFSSVCKFGEETIDYEEKRKHIVYFAVLYNSHCPDYVAYSMKNRYGFDSKKYIEYALKTDENRTLIKKIIEILNKVKNVEGKVLILSPKIDSSNYIAQELSKYYDKSISTIHSKNTAQYNDAARDSDIICSTIQSCGVGVDIHGLRILINTEPFASNVTSNQMSGRLREYSPDLDTYLFDMVDVSIPRVYEMYKQRLRFFKKRCKEIVLYE